MLVETELEFDFPWLSKLWLHQNHESTTNMFSWRNKENIDLNTYHAVGKFSRRQTDIFLAYQKIGFANYANCLWEDSLHEMAKPIFWEE